jgi:hypothetical protein
VGEESGWTSAYKGRVVFRSEAISKPKKVCKVVDLCSIDLTFQRHQIIDPYRAAFEPKVDADANLRPSGHRYLFRCFTYQYHLIQVASIIIEMVCSALYILMMTEPSIQLDVAINLEKERRTCKIWTPIRRIFRWDVWEIPENAEHEDDEDPG